MALLTTPLRVSNTVYDGSFPCSKNSPFQNRLTAQCKTFLGKWVLFAWEQRIIFISMALHLASLWNKGWGLLGNFNLFDGHAFDFPPKIYLEQSEWPWKLQGLGKRETNFTPITGTRISTTNPPAETNKQRVYLLRRTVNIGNDPVGYAKEACSIYVTTEIFRNLRALLMVNTHNILHR